MKRLQAYNPAIGASVAAIIVTPGNVIGLPIGIWALVVLSQRDVRAVFRKTRESGSPGSAMALPSDDAQPSGPPIPSTGGASGTPAPVSRSLGEWASSHSCWRYWASDRNSTC